MNATSVDDPTTTLLVPAVENNGPLLQQQQQQQQGQLLPPLTTPVTTTTPATTDATATEAAAAAPTTPAVDTTTAASTTPTNNQDTNNDTNNNDGVTTVTFCAAGNHCHRVLRGGAGSHEIPARTTTAVNSNDNDNNDMMEQYSCIQCHKAVCGPLCGTPDDHLQITCFACAPGRKPTAKAAKRSSSSPSKPTTPGPTKRAVKKVLRYKETLKRGPKKGAKYEKPISRAEWYKFCHQYRTENRDKSIAAFMRRDDVDLTFSEARRKRMSIMLKEYDEGTLTPDAQGMRYKPSKYPELEQHLSKYLNTLKRMYQCDKIGVSYKWMRAKAKQFIDQIDDQEGKYTDFQISNGWLYNVLKRNGLSGVQVQSGSDDTFDDDPDIYDKIEEEMQVFEQGVAGDKVSAAFSSEGPPVSQAEALLYIDKLKQYAIYEGMDKKEANHILDGFEKKVRDAKLKKIMFQPRSMTDKQEKEALQRQNDALLRQNEELQQKLASAIRERLRYTGP